MSNETAYHDCGNSVCIIGGGPGGLCMARALKRQGLEYEQFERHSDFGGLWDLENPGTPMYESAHFISSRDLSGFLDYPMPKHFPDYPSNRQILEYLRSFAQAFGLYDKVRFNTTVDHVEKDQEGRWIVTLASGERRRYMALVCATGCNWDPNMPEIKGYFSGEIRHSVTYRHPEEFKGKRVMIVGAGNSGADIACDAAANAQQAFISLRRGYHFIPKHILGLPADEVSEKGPQLPMWLTRLVFGGLLRLINGNLERFGLPKPDHKLFESHPLLNSQLLHYLQHGDIKVRPDISHYVGNQVIFKDGSSETVDLVLYATGYKWSCRYATDYFEWKGGRPQMYLSIFSRQHHNLFGIGYLETNSSAYKLFDNEAHLVACYLADQLKRPTQAGEFKSLIQNDEPDLSGGIQFVQSQRHEVYLEVHALKKHMQSLRRRMGWSDLNEGYFSSVRKQPGYVTVSLPQAS
ncbi:NAD(P)/FAD-dependent oxidoreductase [Aquipseudomonas alcaligenes]|uniref:Predicted flavoprotein CzcO associated with the cation diffusion facilitator CzcD n=1 Tax=Aquipseudomonas alcaligenes TaxID=43263 RepID=A0A1N6NPE8_AQUAC|nr:NAD(P)-binding domain-containing protein [Pseudomonas alcaligenes]SIP94018.1 Predicted flavoprotein CzcO associated with the cation diffusion facilitator CzcD [Pseudomonas alcaligenes]